MIHQRDGWLTSGLALGLLALVGLPLAGCSLTAPVEEIPNDCELEFLTDGATSRTLNHPTGSTGAKLAQSFSLSADTEVSNVKVMLERTDTPIGDITAAIFANSGGFPTGSALATSSAINTSIISSTEATEFTFSSPATLTRGALYWLVLEVNYMDSDTDNIAWLGSATDLHAAGSALRTDTGENFVDDTTVEDFTLAVECN